MRWRWALPAALGLGIAALASGCGSLGYYAQAARGGLEILCKKRSIARLLARPDLPPVLRERLTLVQEVRAFASQELALPDNASYRSYADLGRPYASWTVVAAPELATAPVEWCFPIAGCVSYRGYFRRAGAEQFARRLAGEGYDVDLGGVPAFSTLGWLPDPVLNSFVAWPEADLAGLLFHELSHQVAYAPGDTTFNESFATVVEAAGVERWLTTRGRGEELAAWRQEAAHEEAVIALLLAARDELTALYAATAPADRQRARKAELLAELRARYHALAASWGSQRYDGWFDDGLNNARLASFGAYHDLVPAFQARLAALDGDLPRFYAEVQRLAKLPAEERRKELGGAPWQGGHLAAFFPASKVVGLARPTAPRERWHDEILAGLLDER